MAEDGLERTDEELMASDEDAASAAARELMKAICVSGPGTIVSFNRNTQTAKVQPAIKKKFASLGLVDHPPCVDVPVQFPRGGGLVLTFPVAAGDECLLVFSDRAIDNWLAEGGTQEPSEIRFHDPSDAFAIVGFSSNPSAIPDFNMGAAELRTVGGAVIFRAVPPAGGGGGGGGGGGDVQAAVLSERLLDCIRNMTFATGVGPTGVGPINLAEFVNTIKSNSAFVGA